MQDKEGRIVIHMDCRCAIYTTEEEGMQDREGIKHKNRGGGNARYRGDEIHKTHRR